MELIELTTKEEMLNSYELLTEVYPSLTMEEYDRELDLMLPHNYGQVVAVDGSIYAGLSGFWIGTKLWCGKYLELDNVVVADAYRSKGIGKQIFEFLKERAEAENCSMLALDSYTDNFKAHKFFYEKGYIPRGFHFIHILDEERIR